MLFRAEVLEGRSRRAFGRAVPLYAGDSLPVVSVLLVSVIGLALWLATGSYARTAMVGGWVVPAGPTARILPAARGTLVALAVHDGQRVHKGDRLGVVEIQSANDLARDPAQQSLDIVARERAGLSEQRRLARLTNAEDGRRLAAAAQQLRVRIVATDRQIALQRARVASSQRSLAILGDAHAKKYISEIDYQAQRRAHLDERARLQALIVERAGLQGQLDDNEAQRRRLPAELGEKLAALDANDMQLQQRRLDIEGGSTIVLTAPIDGRVTALQARVGQAVGPDRPVMVLLGGDARLAAELYAPSRAIGFARVGQEVRLMYDAFPYQQFGSFRGTIEAISRTALAPDEIDAPLKLAEPAYRVRVRLDAQAVEAFGGVYPIQPGMTLKANVILEKQSFLGWLLEPINAVRHRT
ncbi:MAG TPA: HlyD family efflux transporter periplasmic adaptor subunit [Sphingomonas sp.]|nr:HlyD family efflux transporter periplasmic adaptor subunit [Sphingomonas sp.]